MNIPLGRNIGNVLEVKEAMDFFDGKYDKRLYELSVYISSLMISSAKKISFTNAKKLVINLLESGTPQEARAILPNSLKTEIAVTYNLREWRHFFALRCDKTAHPQMQQITIPLLLEFKKQLSPVFDDIAYNEEFPVEAYGEVKYI